MCNNAFNFLSEIKCSLRFLSDFHCGYTQRHKLLFSNLNMPLSFAARQHNILNDWEIWFLKDFTPYYVIRCGKADGLVHYVGFYCIVNYIFFLPLVSTLLLTTTVLNMWLLIKTALYLILWILLCLLLFFENNISHCLLLLWNAH